MTCDTCAISRTHRFPVSRAQCSPVHLQVPRAPRPADAPTKLACCSWRAPMLTLTGRSSRCVPCLHLVHGGVNHPLSYIHGQRAAPAGSSRGRSGCCQRIKASATAGRAAAHIHLGLVVQHKFASCALRRMRFRLSCWTRMCR